MPTPHETFILFGEGVVLVLEAAAAVVIVLAGARALLAFLRNLVHHVAMPEHERRRFARSLLLGLDFTIGSDVLRIALQPTMEGVLIAGLVVLVRVALTLVLEFELRRGETRDREQETDTTAPSAPRAARHA